MPVLISLPDIIQVDGLDTSDATARDQHIVEGYTAYVQGQKVTGNMPKIGAVTYTPSQSNQIIAKDQYLDGDQTILGDENLVTGNIKSGVSIFGVEGSQYVINTGWQDSYAASANNMQEGRIAFVNGAQITGNVPVLSDIPVVITPTNENQVIATQSKKVFIDKGLTILGDPNLLAENIKSGVSIFGVEGTLVAGSVEKNSYMLYSASANAMDEYGSIIYIEGSNELALQNAATLVTTSPELCNEANEYALNFSYNFLGWGGVGRTCFLTPIEIPSASSDISIKLNVTNGSSVSNFLIRLVQATGETPEELAANIIANSHTSGSYIGLSGYMPYISFENYSTLLYEKINTTDLTGQFYLYIEPTTDNSAPRFKEIEITIK